MSGIGLFDKYIGKHFILRCQQDRRFVIDSKQKQFRGDSRDFHVWEFCNNENQVWSVDKEGHIICVSNPNFIIYASSQKDGTPLSLIPFRGNRDAQSPAARWSLNKDGEIVSLAYANQMINVCGGKMFNGAKMILWHKQGPSIKNDKWELDVVGQAPDIGAFAPFVDLPFIIRNRSSPIHLIDSDKHQRAGGSIMIYGEKKDADQIWTVDKEGHIINLSSPLWCLVAQSKDQSRPDIVEGSEIVFKPLERICKFPADHILSQWRLTKDGDIVPASVPDRRMIPRDEKMDMGIRVVIQGCPPKSMISSKWIVEPPRK